MKLCEQPYEFLIGKSVGSEAGDEPLPRTKPCQEGAHPRCLGDRGCNCRADIFGQCREHIAETTVLQQEAQARHSSGTGCDRLDRKLESQAVREVCARRNGPGKHLEEQSDCSIRTNGRS